MNSKIRVLIVEDDEYKCNDIIKYLDTELKPEVVRSVATAVQTVCTDQYDLVILDMALPTYEKNPNAASGSSQPQGGIEVMRTLKYEHPSTHVLIVSQYAVIEIDNEFVSLTESVQMLNDRYGINVIGAIHYDYESSDWIDSFKDIVEHI